MTITNKQTESVKTLKHIHLDIYFNKAVLPAVASADGVMRVPIRGLSGALGVSYIKQKEKLCADAYLFDILGISKMYDEVYIPVNRVQAFMDTLTPSDIWPSIQGSHGKWLLARHDEWEKIFAEYKALMNLRN